VTSFSDSRVFVAGGRTMAGSAILSALGAAGCRAVIDVADEPDLRDASAVEHFFADRRPEYVFVTAGKTAGIVGNTQAPADLMTDNLLVATHVIPAAWRHGVKHLLYLTSSCTYPKHAPQPLNPDTLWTGPLEPTSAPYAVAKLTGMMMCQAHRRQFGVSFNVAISADAYGPGDDFSLEHSHVVAALVRRMHEGKVANAPEVIVWGSGTPRREFIYVDDLADACVFAMHEYDDERPINLGTATQTSIAELAAIVREVVGYSGALRFDTTKPDGMPLKGLDSSALHGLGWRPSVTVREGIERTYQWFLARH
jgi:GDP-L-fucose synthase